MRRRIGWLLGAVALVLMFLTPRTDAQVLIWADEFDGVAIDPANWGHLFGNGCEYGNCGWGNNELEYYTTSSNNSFVADGALHIVARRENYEGYQFTSARMHTRDRHSFLYGRLEASIKLPTGGGIWPAFWMMPADSVYGGWAASGEIDIMEMVNNAYTVYGTIHYGGGWPNNQHSGGAFSNGTDFSQGFHVYAIEWEPDEIRWYVDGFHYHTETSETWFSSAAPGNDQAPFDQPFYFLLNVAVGGNWPGCTDPSCITASFPQEMLVDWVRVYQIAEPQVEITSPTSGVALQPGNVFIRATATAIAPGATIARVEFHINGTMVGQDTIAPYTHIWEATDGCYRLMARAVDSFGESADSEALAVTVGDGCPSPPFHGYPLPLPGKVEAEDFDLGGAGQSYFDTTGGNSGNAYRLSEDVDIEGCSEGGYNVGWMGPAEWLLYTVDVRQAGTYSVQARVASQDDGGRFHVEFDGVNLTGDMNVPVTGDWQNWQTISATVDLAAGIQQMRFVNRDDPDSYNLNYFNLVLLSPVGDIDQDGDLDMADHAKFTDCLAGPNQTTPPAGCTPTQFERSDFDGDGDVDARDFAIEQELPR